MVKASSKCHFNSLSANNELWNHDSMKNLFLVFLLLGLTSCASYLRTSASKMISPEANGGFLKGTADIRIQHHQSYQMDFTTSPNAPLDDRGEFPGLDLYADLGLLERFDFYLDPALELTPTVFGLKYQFMGETRKNAKAGNISGALAVGYGSNDTSKSGSDASDLDIFDGNVKNISMTQDHFELGLIYGYRWVDPLLQYVNLFYMTDRAKGDFTNSSGTLVDQDFKYASTAWLISTGFMVYLNSNLHFKIDYSYMTSDWDFTATQTSHTFNGGVGINW